MRDRTGEGPDRIGGREELQGVEGGETLFRFYCKRKESLLNRSVDNKSIL